MWIENFYEGSRKPFNNQGKDEEKKMLVNCKVGKLWMLEDSKGALKWVNEKLEIPFHVIEYLQLLLFYK